MTNKKINNYFEQESGRSMVEMLGVLAIIGVLSVGGISGYTTAMNKHKANEILNAAAVRAMAVSTQLQSGATPSLDEFPTGEVVGGATFGDVTKTGDKFKIGFDLDNNAVLDQIRNIAGTDGIVRGITGDGLIYNDDLTTGERASDFDGDTTKCVGPKYTYCSLTGTCITGANQTESCPTDCATMYTGSTTTAIGGTKIGNTLCYCPANTKWTGTECKSTQKEFYVLKEGPYDGYYTHEQAQSACQLATLEEFFTAIGGREKCTPQNGNNYSGCDYGPLSELISDTGAVWLDDCWSSESAGKKATDCSSGSAWCVNDDGDVHSCVRDLEYSYALCVR